MVTKPRANSVITHAVDGSVITFNVAGAGSIALDMAKVSQSNINRAALHGFIQRVSDGAALSRNTDTGLPATPQEKLSAMSRIVDHLNSGSDEWTLNRGPGSTDGLLVRAIHESLGGDIDRIREKVKSWTKAQRASVAQSESIAPIYNRLVRESAGDVDAEALLTELV